MEKKMFNLPLNHKTILLFDHSSYFSTNCGETFEFDATIKSKQPNQAQNNQQANSQIKLNPLSKTIWTCSIEAAVEFARVVYDLFPHTKLIRMITSKNDNTLNSWHENEQGLEHIMNVLGTIQPPLPNTRETYPGEDFINLCRALNICVNSIAQVSQLQQISIKNKPPNQQIINSGRIILFTSSQIRNLDQIQEFLVKSIEESNKIIDQNANSIDSNLIKLNKIELVIIDVVLADQKLTLEKEIIKRNSAELRTHLLSAKSGSSLPLKLISLAQKFYDLSVTSVTNIPMKEELNANSSANYDVDILHHKSLHDQLKICGLLKNCIIQKDGVNAVCLKWSNPKTNITEFNLTTCSFRITPIDVNSRPSSCLTSFLLSGRCVVLEIPRSSTSNKISSHVLCTHGNEIFMHCLNYSSKSNFESRPSIDNLGDKLKDCRTNEFIEFMKSNTLTRLSNLYDKDFFRPQKIIDKFDKLTRNWPCTYSEKIISNLVQLKPIITRCISDEPLTDIQYNECIKCIEAIQNAELKMEPITNSMLITQVDDMSVYKRKDIYKQIWIELESFLLNFKDFSDKHKILYNHVKTIKTNLIKNENLFSRNADPRKALKTQELNKTQESITISREVIEFENDKLSKRKKFSKELNTELESNLFDIWSKTLNEKNKIRMDFYGRSVNPPNQIAPLYTNLKLDEINTGKISGAKMEIS